MIQDHRIDWMRKRIWIPPFYMQGIGMHAAADVVLHSLETIAAEYSEITSVGMGCVTMGDGEFINGYIPCPHDVDPNYPIGYKVAWTLDHDGAGAASATWILLTGLEKVGQAISLPATALDTPFGLDTYKDAFGDITVVTDFLLQWTSRGIDTLIGLTRAEIEAGAFLTYKLEMDAAVNETTVRLIGIMMDYVPMKTVGTGCHLDKPLQSDGVA